MNFTNLGRIAVGAGAVALTASFVGFGTANAESASADHTHGQTSFTRTVSNTTPKIGETFTVTTEFHRNKGVTEKIWHIKDLHNSCLTYVADSAEWETLPLPANEVETVQEDAEAPGMGHVLVGPANKGDWKVKKGETGRFSLDYKVTSDCEVGAELTSTFHYDGNKGGANYDAADFDGGPVVTVQKADDEGTGGDDGDDTPDAGSLGNFFGSLSTGSASS